MHRSEKILNRDKSILKILLEERAVRSSHLREFFNISKATLSDCLKRLREETAFEIHADKNGIIYLEGDEDRIRDYLIQCSYEPVSVHCVTEWMIMFIMRAEDRCMTFNELYEAVCEFFGLFVSASAFRKVLKDMENRLHIVIKAVSNGNNTFLYSLSNNAPIFSVLSKKSISSMKVNLCSIICMYEECQT